MAALSKCSYFSSQKRKKLQLGRTFHLPLLFIFRDILNPKDVITTPFENSSPSKDFCSQSCLSSYELKKNLLLPYIPVAFQLSASMCQKNADVSFVFVEILFTVRGFLHLLTLCLCVFFFPRFDLKLNIKMVHGLCKRAVFQNFILPTTSAWTVVRTVGATTVNSGPCQIPEGV